MVKDPEKMRARLEKQRVRSKRRYDDLRSRGLCTRNPAHGPTDGGVHCGPCKVDWTLDRKGANR
jgi:hypothetical protein